MAEKLGRYILERKIATGGMAEVFLARQAGPGGFEKVCVIKRMLLPLSSDEHFVRMFLDEARLVAQLNHPNIAQIFDFGEHEGAYFLAMEYVAGSNLRAIVKDHAKRGLMIPVQLAARIISQTAVALDYAHEARGTDGQPLNIIHRDVSPQNILLGQTGVVKLIDFGVAKAAGASQKTATGMIKGKIAYMSPEQLRGHPLDRRSDVFGLGLVLYELLAARRAYEGANDVAIMQAATKMQMKPLQEVRADIPPALHAIVRSSLSRERESRYASAAQMAFDLEQYLAQSGVTVTGADLARLLPNDAAVAPLSRIEGTPASAEAAPIAAPIRPPKQSVWDTSPTAPTVIDSTLQPPKAPANDPATSATAALLDAKPTERLRSPRAPARSPTSESTGGLAQVRPAVPPPRAPAPSPAPSSEQTQQSVSVLAESSSSVVRRAVRRTLLPWLMAGVVLAAGAAMVVTVVLDARRTPRSDPSLPLPLRAGAIDAGALQQDALPVIVAPPAAPIADAGAAAQVAIDAAAVQIAAIEAPDAGPVRSAPSDIRRGDRPKAAQGGSKAAKPERTEGPVATLHVASTPAMQVWIDGKPRGITPTTLTLPSGDHSLQFRDETSGLAHARSVRLENGEERREEWRAGRGKVAFRVVPYGEVFLGTRLLGLTPLPPVELWQGKYTFRFVNPETRREETREVEVVPNEEAIVKVDLRAK